MFFLFFFFFSFEPEDNNASSVEMYNIHQSFEINIWECA